MQVQTENINVPFINEYIPEADVKKYDLGEIDKRFIVGGTYARDWTIDRERDIYLRRVANGREEFRQQSTWSFYWKGTLLTVELDTIRGGGVRGGHGWTHYKMRQMWMPPSLVSAREEIIADLREALTAEKGGGVYSTRTTSDTTLDMV